MNIDQLDQQTRSLLVLAMVAFVTVFISSYFAYRKDRNLPKGHPKKKGYTALHFIMGPLMPFWLIPAMIVGYFFLSILFGVGMIVFTVGLLSIRKALWVKVLFKKLTKLGEFLLGAANFLLFPFIYLFRKLTGFSTV